MTNDERKRYMASLAEAELARQRTQSTVQEDTDPRAGWMARLADMWKQPPPEGDVMVQFGDDGKAITIAAGLKKARPRPKIVVAKTGDGDPREQWIGRLITGRG